MATVKIVYGTCCTCEENVPCTRTENIDGEDATIAVVGAVAVNPFDFECVEHFSYGVKCDGSGMCPQAAWIEGED
jgi:hypothetical protein